MADVKIIVYPTFKKTAKVLAKKYNTFAQDYESLLESLKADPNLGTDLGNGLRKIRVSIKSKGKGKSGGARVISYVLHRTETEVNLLYVYDKSNRSSISSKELQQLLKQNGLI